MEGTQGSQNKTDRPQVFRVAIIDDEMRNASILKLELCRDKRLEVKNAGPGLDAVVLVKNLKPDIILVHYNPANQKSKEFMERLVGLVAQLKSKVVVYTWSTGGVDQGKVMEVGASMAHDVTQTLRHIIQRMYEKLGLSR